MKLTRWAAVSLAASLASLAAPVCAQSAAAQSGQMSAEEMEAALGLGKAAKAPPAGSTDTARYRAIGFDLGTPEASPQTGNKAGPDVANSGPAGARHFSVPIEFETASARISRRYLTTISNLQTVMGRNPALRLEIRGHTDAQGDPDRNMQLSERRAQAVRDALISRGISSDRLSAQGYGQTSPLPGANPYDPRNRRVEFVNAN